MSNPFSTPGAPGESVPFAELKGSLLILKVQGMETGIQTVHGPADAVRADISVLDGPKAGEEYADALVFPRVLKGQLSRKVGELVLGRLGQGVAKPGQSAPWILDAPSEADVQAGQQHLSKAGPQLTGPSHSSGSTPPF